MMCQTPEPPEEGCEHYWVAQESEEVCINCGLVGQPVYETMQIGSPPSPQPHHSNSPLHFLSDEVTETIMRLSGGDCTRIHVEAVMAKLGKWYDAGDKRVRDLICHLSNNPNHTSRGVLAVAIHRGLLSNGRQETMDHVASMVGATRLAVSTAERLLKEPREYLRSPVLVAKVVDSIDGLDHHWGECIKALAEQHIICSFREIDVVVAATALHFAREVKSFMHQHKSILSPRSVASARRNLRLLTGASLCRRLRLTYSTVSRASKCLDATTLDKTGCMAEGVVLPQPSTNV